MDMKNISMPYEEHVFEVVVKQVISEMSVEIGGFMRVGSRPSGRGQFDHSLLAIPDHYHVSQSCSSPRCDVFVVEKRTQPGVPTPDVHVWFRIVL